VPPVMNNILLSKIINFPPNNSIDVSLNHVNPSNNHLLFKISSSQVKS
jgi:hypothetical protein